MGNPASIIIARLGGEAAVVAITGTAYTAPYRWQAARAKVESFLGQSVYLDRWVKVLPNWRKNANAMARFGYRLKEEKR